MKIVFEVGDSFTSETGDTFGVVVKENEAIFITKPNELFDHYFVSAGEINADKENKGWKLVNLEEIAKSGSPEQKLMKSMIYIALETRGVLTRARE
ncbi:MAG TPA: hypothetical protein PLI45_02860 [Candidatus Woesebacteria bacterium]|nr:hypothetical protein [Candidatus Woesebacteria bacterium]